MIDNENHELLCIDPLRKFSIFIYDFLIADKNICVLQDRVSISMMATWVATDNTQCLNGDVAGRASHAISSLSVSS